MVAPPHALDADARRRFGRYYTPAPMVRGLYRLLADALAVQGLSAAACTLVDPCCGPGAFLGEEAAAYRARLGLDLDADALAQARQAAPDATFLLGDAYAEGLSALEEVLKGAGPVAVIGNPPYVGNSELLKSGRYHEVRDRLLPFAREVAEGTSIRDDYALFFGVADRLIEAAGGLGAIAYVTSASFVDNFLYTPMRRWLLSRYRLHALVEAGPKLFEGAKVATVLSVWVRDSRGTSDFLHARLDGTVEHRLAQLEQGPSLRRVAPQGEGLLLNAPSTAALTTLEQMRRAGDPIGSIPLVSMPGLKTRFDELLVADSRGELITRMLDFFRAPNPEWFDRRHPVPPGALEKLQAAFEARGRTSYSLDAIRPFARYAGAKHRFRVPEKAMQWAYVDRALIPRGDHRFRGAWDPHREGPKLVFNVREVPLSSALVEGDACVHDHRHARFAPLRVPQAAVRGANARLTESELEPLVLNLSPRWTEAAALLREPADVFRYVCAVVNSRMVQQQFAPIAGASEEVPVPRFGKKDRANVQALADFARGAGPGAALGEDEERRGAALYGLA